MLKGLSLRTKLFIASAGISVILILVGASGYYFLKDVSTKFSHVTEENLPKLDELGKLQISAADAVSNLRRSERSKTPEEFKQRIVEMINSIDDYEKADKIYSTFELDAKEKELHQKQHIKWEALSDVLLKVAEVLKSKELENKSKSEEIEKIEKEVEESRRAYATEIDALIDYQHNEAKTWVEAARKSSERANVQSLVFVLGGALVSLLVGYFLAGNLVASLRNVSGKLDEAASSTSSASSQLSSAAQQLSAGATEGAASLEETVSSLEELASMVKLSADNAKQAAALSQTSRRSAEEGEVEIKKLINSVSDVATSSKQIEEIINVIDDIAFQTNLLALNAAVEAARAGEQGKGFAVVAEAVRSLAQRSAAAAKDITKLIEDSVEKTESGVKIADQSGVLLKEIVTTVKKVADLNMEISTASQQQSTGLNQISKAMSQLDQVIQSNAASAEEAAASSVEMSGQAVALQDQVKSLAIIIDGEKNFLLSKDGTSLQAETQNKMQNKTESSGNQARTVTANSQSGFRTSIKSGRDPEKVIPFKSGSDSTASGKVGNTEGF